MLPCGLKYGQVLEKNGERGRNRTFNLLIKSQLLCQLSYAPTVGKNPVGRNKNYNIHFHITLETAIMNAHTSRRVARANALPRVKIDFREDRFEPTCVFTDAGGIPRPDFRTRWSLGAVETTSTSPPEDGVQSFRSPALPCRLHMQSMQNSARCTCG